MSRGVEFLLNNHSYFYLISSGLIELQAGWVFPVLRRVVCVRLRLCLFCAGFCGTQTLLLWPREQRECLGFASTELWKLSLNSHWFSNTGFFSRLFIWLALCFPRRAGILFLLYLKHYPVAVLVQRVCRWFWNWFKSMECTSISNWLFLVMSHLSTDRFSELLTQENFFLPCWVGKEDGAFSPTFSPNSALLGTVSFPSLVWYSILRY